MIAFTRFGGIGFVREKRNQSLRSPRKISPEASQWRGMER
jgi:hypothetical protein